MWLTRDKYGRNHVALWLKEPAYDDYYGHYHGEGFVKNLSLEEEEK